MPLPGAETALSCDSELSGLVAAGGGLSVSRLKEAYSKGMFPWFSKGQPVLWWSPDPRMVLQIQDFKLHRSLRKTLQAFVHSAGAEVKFDTAFSQVIRHCAQAPRAGQHGTWILEDMIRAYEALHHAGVAHSVETWIDNKLVGGLYCVSLGHAIFGESMFALRTDASKIALAGLVAFAKAHGVRWIDCQQNTRHLASLGAHEIKRAMFLEGVREASQQHPLDWKYRPIYWSQLMPTQALT